MPQLLTSGKLLKWSGRGLLRGGLPPALSDINVVFDGLTLYH